jgi:hypothetical protein
MLEALQHSNFDLVPEVVAAVLAADLALGRDNYAMRWIKAYRKRAASAVN